MDAYVIIACWVALHECYADRYAHDIPHWVNAVSNFSGCTTSLTFWNCYFLSEVVESVSSLGDLFEVERVYITVGVHSGRLALNFGEEISLDISTHQVLGTNLSPLHNATDLWIHYEI
jgi:hypothetical protein